MGKPNVNVIIGAYQKTESAYERVVLKGGVDIAQQLNKEGCIYEVRFIFDLKGKEVTVPANSILDFEGGSIENGSLVLDNTLLDGNVAFGSDLAISGTCNNQDAYQKWFENNDVDAWHRFINNVEGPTNYDYESGRYDTTVSIIKDVDGVINLNGNGAELHFTNLSKVINSGYCIYLRPDNLDITDYYLKAGTDSKTETEYLDTAKRGDVAIMLENTEGLSPHDHLCIQDTTPSSFSFERDYIQGEYVDILSVDKDTNVVQLSNALLGQYLHPAEFITVSEEKHFVKGVRVQKFHTFSGSVRDMTIYVDDNNIPNNNGLNIRRGFNIVIDNVKVYDGTYLCINIEQTQLVAINNCVCESAEDQGKNLGVYGYGASDCQSVTIDGGKFKGWYHGIAHGGHYNTNLSIVNRDIELRNVVARGATSAHGFRGINFHANTENIRILGCRATGIGGAGRYNTIRDCIVSGILTISPIVSYSHTIENNIVDVEIDVSVGKIGSTGVDGNWCGDEGAEHLVIKNNTVKGFLYLRPSSMTTYRNWANVVFDIEGNTIENAKFLILAGSNPDIVSEGKLGYDYGRVRFANNVITGCTGNIRGRDVVFEDNTMKDNSLLVGFYNCRINNNKCTDSVIKADLELVEPEKAGLLYIGNNVVTSGNLFGFRVTSAAVKQYAVKDIIVENNVMCQGTEQNTIIDISSTTPDVMTYVRNNKFLNTNQVKMTTGNTFYEKNNLTGDFYVDHKFNVDASIKYIKEARGTFAEKPDINSLVDGYAYQCTDLDKTIYTSFDKLITSVSVPRTESVEMENPFEEGTRIHVKVTNNNFVIKLKSNSTGDVIEYPTNNDESSFYFRTAVFNAPNPYVYDVLEVDFPGTAPGVTGTASFYSGRWIEEDGAAANVARKGTFANRPSDEDIYKGFKYFDITKNETVTYDGDNVWLSYDNSVASSSKRRYGTHSQRPSGADINIGYWYFDTSLGKPICWNGNTWVEGDGGSINYNTTKGHSRYLVDGNMDITTVPFGFAFYAEDLDKVLHFGKPINERLVASFLEAGQSTFIDNTLESMERYVFRATRKSIDLYASRVGRGTPTEDDLVMLVNGSADGNTGFDNYAEFNGLSVADGYPYLYIINRRTSGASANCYIADVDKRWFEEDGVVGVYLTDNPKYTKRSGTLAQAPTVADNAIYVGFEYYDTTNKKPIYWNGTKWVDAYNFSPALSKGTTSNRPVGIHTESDVTSGSLATTDIGFAYYDTTLNKIIYAKAINGTTGAVTWVDALGEPLEVASEENTEQG